MKMNKLISVAKKIREKQSIFKYRWRDILQRLKFGKKSPKYCEGFFIEPNECTKFISADVITKLTGLEPRRASGLIIESEWPMNKARSVFDLPKYKFCYEHWVNGIPWEKTGAYDYLLKIIEVQGNADNCRTYNDVVKRYERLDAIFDQIKKEGRIKSRQEMKPGNFRESQGVIIHIGPQGTLYFGDGGFHRFSIASILDLKLPAMVGCVHCTSLDKFDHLRKKNQS